MKNLLCLPLGKPEPFCPQNALRSYKTTDATCSGITLVNFGVNTSKTTCCPEDSLSCGGCQVYSSGKCEKCLGGYRLQGEMCEACANTLGWTNELGQTCDGITMSGCNDRPVTGQSSNQACCICGGGTKSPTPFMYPDKRFALGDEVMLKPLPRTARRYSLNADCGLGAHNLTFDGTTGAIYYSSQKPLKAFSVQCEVSAHQAGVSPHSFPIFVGDGCHQFLSFSCYVLWKVKLTHKRNPGLRRQFQFSVDFLGVTTTFFLRGTWFGGDCQSLRIGGSHDLRCQRFGVFSHCDILSSDCQNSGRLEGFQLGLCT